MKRSAELTPLSHDHHQALFLAMKLRRAEDIDEAAVDLATYWETHGRRHFEIEEEILLPAWFGADEGADSDMAARLAREHLQIRVAVRSIAAGSADLADVRTLGRLLGDHVRFEERELFPMVEERLDAETLTSLGAEIAAAEADDPEEP